MNNYEENLLSVFTIAMTYSENPTQHVHKFHEFYFCLEGEGSQHIGENIIKMKKDELFFFPAGLRHMGNGLKNGGCLGCVVYVAKDIFSEHSFPDDIGASILNTLSTYTYANKNKLPISSEGSILIKNCLMTALKEAAARKKGYRLAIKNALSSFLIEIMRNSRIEFNSLNSDSLIFDDGRIRDICLMIEENISEAYTIDHAAAMANLSRSRFHTLFKKTTGRTFIEYLSILRVNTAMLLLKETSLPVSEIAIRCGFNSIGNFFSVFKRYTGLTPEKARNIKRRSDPINPIIQGKH